MRIIYASFLVFLSCAAISAQSPVDSSANSGVLVVNKNWRVSIPFSASENEDPFRANNEARQTQNDIKDNMRQNEIRIRSGLPPEAPRPRLRTVRVNSSVASLPAVYFYRTKIRNTSARTIRKVNWDYVFFEQGTNLEVGRRRLVNEIKVAPNKTKNLIVRSASPPTGSVSAANAGKKLRNRYSEQIIIQSIEFADGTVWQSGATPGN